MGFVVTLSLLHTLISGLAEAWTWQDDDCCHTAWVDDLWQDPGHCCPCQSLLTCSLKKMVHNVCICVVWWWHYIRGYEISLHGPHCPWTTYSMWFYHIPTLFYYWILTWKKKKKICFLSFNPNRYLPIGVNFWLTGDMWHTPLKKLCHNSLCRCIAKTIISHH